MLDYEKLVTWMKAKEAALVSVCVVLKNLEHQTPFTENINLNQYCKNVLLNKVVENHKSVNLLDCKLAKAYGICHIVIKSYEPKFHDGTECVVITKRTSINIEAVQSLDFYNLRGSITSVSLGGFGYEIQQLTLLFNYNKSYNNSLFRPIGVLLHGPPGCGKTSLAKHIANKCNAVFLKLEGSNILQSEFGAGAKNLRNYFKRASALSKEGSVVLFLDEIDTLCPRHEHASIGNKQLISALVTEMDRLHDNNVSGLLVIAATNFISSVSSALRRPGRFDHEVLINIPTKQQRLQILEVHTADMTLASDVSLPDVALWTVGFVGADMKALCEEAAGHAHSQTLLQDNQTPMIQMSDFVHALHTVRPSLKKGLDCAIDLQPVTWKEIGGLEEVKAEIRQSIEWPILYPDVLHRLHLTATKGVLLYGPPGCCKTTIVRAAATSCNVTFLTLNGAQVYSPYVGESERIISEAFQKARALSPAILFFDEIESLVGSRTTSSNHSKVQERILSTMLNEMDGVGIRLDRKLDAILTRQSGHDQKMMPGDSSLNNFSENTVPDLNKSHVIVIGATNRPDMLDPAILRPGRLDKMIYVPPPDEKSRQCILKIQTSKMSTSGIELEEISKKTEYFSGADLKNLCKEAGLIALRENLNREDADCSNLCVTNSHFTQALDIVKASLKDSFVHV